MSYSPPSWQAPAPVEPPVHPPPPASVPSPSAQKRRDGPRGWALATFALLSLACLVGLVLAASGGRLPDLGQAETSWTPQTVVETAVVVSPSRVAEDTRFAVGDAVQNVSAGPVNLRRSPGFQNKQADDVLAAVPSGALGSVVGGPQSADGLVWWQVSFGETVGWMAERSSRGVALLDRAP